MLWIFLALFAYAEARLVLDLDCVSCWKIENSNKSISVNGSVPGGIYSDLTSAGFVKGGILYGFNDVTTRWIATESWTYSRKFVVSSDIFNYRFKEFQFDGIDGIATVFLNDVEIGKVNDTFVSYNFRVDDDALKSKGDNEIKVKFESPVESGERLFSEMVRFSHAVPPSCPPRDYNGECHVNVLRRMQASFAWDWGPAFPSVGLWKSVRIAASDPGLTSIRIKDVVISTEFRDSSWRLDFAVKLRAHGDGKLWKGVLSATMPHFFRSFWDVSIPVENGEGFVESRHVIFHKNDVERWWPNGFGDQTLYNLTIRLQMVGKGAAAGPTFVVADQKSVRIGFRTVRLVQNPVDDKNETKGLTFYFEINGVPIFAKGSNWIPSNILLEKGADPETLRHLLQSAKDSNMNMLRVWGGGVYESDLFYQLCDELGLMVWQDMMFACAMYPANENFLESVTMEIKQQISRLQHHASIVLWAGNNENEAALSGNWYETKSNFSIFREEYVKLYVDTVERAVYASDITRSFLTSSPTNGIESAEEGFVAKNPYSPYYGDVHYYNYVSDGWYSNAYPNTRFSSEYGFQSLPSMETLEKIASAEDLASLKTPFFRHRQHLPLGYLYLIWGVISHFPPPPLRRVETFIYLTQINQAVSVKHQTEWYRKRRNILLPNGAGLTMGALYWQLNDVWQAPSWSSIEYGGKWKMLQYYAKNFFAPVLISADMEGEDVFNVNVINDMLRDFPRAKISISAYSWNSTSLKSLHIPVRVKRESAMTIFTSSLAGIMDEFRCENKNHCFFQLSLMDVDDNGNETKISPDNFFFPTASFWNLAGLDTNITVQIDIINSNASHHEIRLKTSSVALFVWLEAYGLEGTFSDNGLVIINTRTVTFKSKFPYIDGKKLKSRLRCTVLNNVLRESDYWDLYHAFNGNKWGKSEEEMKKIYYNDYYDSVIV